MPRIQPVNVETASPTTVALLDGVKSQMGRVPNIVATMANSEATAKAYLAFNGALASGNLSRRLREKIALVVAETNDCQYCLSAHSVLAGKAGAKEQEIIDARQGMATDEKSSAVLSFAKKLVNDRGQISDDDVQQLRDAGWGPGEIAETVAVVALNIFTNYFNHVAGTEVDFPRVSSAEAA